MYNYNCNYLLLKYQFSLKSKHMSLNLCFVEQFYIHIIHISNFLTNLPILSEFSSFAHVLCNEVSPIFSNPFFSFSFSLSTDVPFKSSLKNASRIITSNEVEAVRKKKNAFVRYIYIYLMETKVYQ